MIAAKGTTSQFSKKHSNTRYIISKWTKIDPPDLYQLEEKTWAPWLRKPQKNFAKIIKLFSEGQRKITDIQGKVIAMISTNRINWNGNPESLHTWDATAGGSIELSDFSRTYIPDGNTLDIMSISVDPEMQGKGLATILFREIIDMADYLGVKHLIASFRPCEYGNFKLNSHKLISFDEYCKVTTATGLPWDPWLRVATKYGMEPLRIEKTAIKVEVSLATFEEYRRAYNKNKWSQIDDLEWECGEAGTWKVNHDRATYAEPNLWGEIPIK